MPKALVYFCNFVIVCHLLVSTVSKSFLRCDNLTSSHSLFLVHPVAKPVKFEIRHSRVKDHSHLQVNTRQTHQSSPSFVFVCTGRTMIVAHVKDPISTRSMTEGLTAGDLFGNTQITRNSHRRIR